MDSARVMIPLQQTSKNETELHSSLPTTSPRVQISGYLKKKRNVSIVFGYLTFLGSNMSIGLSLNNLDVEREF